MELHNTVEKLVIQKIDEIFAWLEEKGNPDDYCVCEKCRLDTACYVLNRTAPHYVVSSRGASRLNKTDAHYQQKIADVTILVYEGIKRVNHNQRHGIPHTHPKDQPEADGEKPVFNIPTFLGRVFNGENFEPVTGIKVLLLRGQYMVKMKDNNWQNPYNLIPNTEGNYTFWPEPIPALSENEYSVFEYSIKIDVPEYEPLEYFFKIPVRSEIRTKKSFSMERTFKLPDLYLFPPGETEKSFSLLD